MAAGDLTTLTKARNHLAIKGTDADAILLERITSSSRWVLSQLGRPILAATYTETRDGNGRTRILLDRCPPTADSPPIAVTSVTVDGSVIPPRPAVTTQNTNPDGWYVSDYGVNLVGSTFTRGQQNVVIVYSVGYEVAGEAGTIPAAPGPYTIQAALFFGGDRGVTINTVAAIKVTGTPAAGQYAVSDSGLYTFAAADTGKTVALTYATCPDDLEQAVVEHVALRYKDRGHEGLSSSSALGENVGYTATGGTIAYIEGVLDRYRAIGVG